MRWLIISVLILFPSTLKAEAIAISELISVYDGDTFFVNINDLPDVFGKRIGVRVNNIDTPELKRYKCKKEKDLAIVARQHTFDLLSKATVIELRNIKRDKYFRIVADVYADGINLSNSLYKKNLGFLYDGGTKKSFCD